MHSHLTPKRMALYSRLHLTSNTYSFHISYQYGYPQLGMRQIYACISRVFCGSKFHLAN